MRGCAPFERAEVALGRDRDHRVGAVLPLQLGRGAEGEHLAVVEDRDPLAERVGLLHVVGGQEDRQPVAVEIAEDAPEVVAGLGVEPRGRLVEEEHLRPVRERAGDHQALGEPARELEDHRGRPLAECELVEQLVGAVPGRAAREAEEAAVVVEVLPDRERAVERVRLRDDPDPALRRGRVGADVDPGDEGAAAGRDRRSSLASRSSSTCRPRSGRAARRTRRARSRDRRRRRPSPGRSGSRRPCGAPPSGSAAHAAPPAPRVSPRPPSSAAPRHRRGGERSRGERETEARCERSPEVHPDQATRRSTPGRATRPGRPGGTRPGEGALPARLDFERCGCSASTSAAPSPTPFSSRTVV